ncbi:MAG: dienelactone hydrolase family protein [Acidimicrobiales bacterium]
MGEIIEFPSNGSTGHGYLALPKSGQGPGLIVIQEWWGLVDHIEDLCDRFAAEGFVALAPDLYHGEKTSEPDEAGKLMMALQLNRAGMDMSGAVDEVLRRSGRGALGVIGFCMGGGLALVLATQRPDAVRVCLPFYGLIPWPQARPDYAAMTAVMEGHYAERDEYFNPEAARALEQELKGLGKQVEIIIHPDCDHAFFNDTRPEVYNQAEAAKAWDSALKILRSNLS